MIGEKAVSWHTIQMLKHISIHNTVYSQTELYPHHLAGDPDFSLAHTPPGLWLQTASWHCSRGTPTSPAQGQSWRRSQEWILLQLWPTWQSHTWPWQQSCGKHHWSEHCYNLHINGSASTTPSTSTSTSTSSFCTSSSISYHNPFNGFLNERTSQLQSYYKGTNVILITF